MAMEQSEFRGGQRIPQVGTTGRYLVLMKEGTGSDGVQALDRNVGITMTSHANYLDSSPSETNTGTFFETIGVAVVDAAPENLTTLGLQSSGDSAILAVEPERIVYATGNTLWPQGVYGPNTATSGKEYDLNYLRGYRDAIDHLTGTILGDGGRNEENRSSVSAMADDRFTWGLQVTKVAESHFSGKGTRIAVLDTGLDLAHPDFAGRTIVSKSFVRTPSAQDGHGHGTHCVGVACGTKNPVTPPRYGIAYDADIYVAKVLNDQGNGGDADILAGIDWAIQNECHVASMSLGSRVSVGQPFSPIFEQVARRALAAGTLLIAAAGNDSYRPANILPVNHPANCPSILAIAALDQQMQVAFFSNAGLNPQGGQIDFAAPGVQVRSSWPIPVNYKTISGTSMATPHVAGIAALWAEARPGTRGAALHALLTQSASRLPLPSSDAGSGLIQAP